MKKSKKVLSVFLMILMVCMLTACGTDNNNGNADDMAGNNTNTGTTTDTGTTGTDNTATDDNTTGNANNNATTDTGAGAVTNDGNAVNGSTMTDDTTTDTNTDTNSTTEANTGNDDSLLDDAGMWIMLQMVYPTSQMTLLVTVQIMTRQTLQQTTMPLRVMVQQTIVNLLFLISLKSEAV